MAATTLIPTAPEPFDGGVLLCDVGWNDYEAMLAIVGDRHIRVTYDSGTMEVTMPSQRHELASQWLGLFVPRLAEEMNISFVPLRMTTRRRADAEKGLEADQCYYIQNQAIVRDRRVLNLEVDPPPDLPIEVDITSSSLKRMGIYARLRVPQVWRYNGQKLTILLLGPDGEYMPAEESLSFPGLTPADVERFVELAATMDKLRWARELRTWVHSELIPRRGVK